MRLLFLLLLIFPASFTAGAQAFFPERSRTVPSSADTLQLDTLSIIPGRITVKDQQGNSIDSSCWKVLTPSAQFIWLKKPAADSVVVSYSVFPLLFTAKTQHKDQFQMTASPENRVNPFQYNPQKQKSDDPFAMGGLNKSGSLSRGISFGNNRDVSVNSNLNLQISGRLTDNVDLMMVATDDNLPLQADGTTQQLQEFDRVYIQLSSPNNKVIAGDFFTEKRDGYFMRYNKRGQGITTMNTIPLSGDAKKGSRLFVNASAAVSRGKFARNVIQGVEGNQGPYRLRGAENELFIIVLSGTEQVYIDGKLMVRGQENDYIIDYNTAEITFTAKQIITKDKRIVVEFQYSDRNYARSLIQSGVAWEKKDETKKISIALNAYSEQDHKNQPVQQTLTDEDKLVLSQVGDTLLQAVISGADSVGFSSSEVRYQKKDTLVGTVLYNDIYIFSTDPDSAVYRCSFWYVGPGNGNYKQVNASANGKVYEWIAPIGNAPQGDYEPIVVIVTPKKRQMVTAGTILATKNSEWMAEGAVSNYDLNTFSSADGKDDLGYGGAFGWKTKSFVRDSLELTAQTRVEYMSRHFTFVERYRPVEFERDWNLGWGTQRKPTADQIIFQGGVKLNSLKHGISGGYDAGSFLEGDAYQGIRNGMQFGIQKKRIRLQLNGSLLNSSGTYGKTDFAREKLTLSIPINKVLSVGGWQEYEFSRIRKPNSDTLQSTSFGYVEWESYIQAGDSTKSSLRLFYKQRTDWLPQFAKLTQATYGESYGATYTINKLKDQRLSLTATYRRLDIRNPQVINQQKDENLLGRLEYSLRALKGVISLNTFYETGSGLEVKREFFYLEVPVGQGNYTWTDYNSNGVKELNEFEIALFTDQANYIRVFTPTNQFVKVYTNQFTQGLNIKAPADWNKKKKGLKKFLARFSDQVVYRTDRKTMSRELKDIYLPLLEDAGDTALVTLNATIRNTVFFNQLSSKFGMDYTWQETRGKNLLTNGLEARSNQFHQARIRWNINSSFSLLTEYKNGVKINISEFFPTRNYRIEYQEVEPRISYQPGTTFRFSLIYRYAEKNNTADLGGEKAIHQKAGAEIRVTKISKGGLTAEFNFIRIAYNGEVSSTTGYEMLEGLKPGQNYTWRAGWQQSLGQSLQLTLGYEGRKTPDNKAIHNGTAQVRAMF